MTISTESKIKINDIVRENKALALEAAELVVLQRVHLCKVELADIAFARAQIDALINSNYDDIDALEYPLYDFDDDYYDDDYDDDYDYFSSPSHLWDNFEENERYRIENSTPSIGQAAWSQYVEYVDVFVDGEAHEYNGGVEVFMDHQSNLVDIMHQGECIAYNTLDRESKDRVNDLIERNKLAQSALFN
jgi:hypothetical protein